MDSNLVRKHFIDFFKSKSHQVNSSSSLIVKNDPTLMFVNSGMVPFKEFFLENSTSKYKRITNSQKCLRVSGKHNDLDEVGYDTRPYAKAFYTPDNKDYITIKRDSIDRNAWSRYNRWFHRSVIEATAEVSGFTPELNEDDRAKRPIIEFDSGLALFNHGTVAKKSVTLYDTVTTDAFSEVVQQTGYIIDGITLASGMRRPQTPTT